MNKNKIFNERHKGFLNVEPINAPNDLDHIQEYICNDGFYFAECAWPFRKNHKCEYLKHDCTGCK